MEPENIPIIHRKNTMYYYTEEYGLAAKRILDKLASEHNPVRVRAEHIVVGTVRLRWYHGVHYLMDNLDPDKIYAKLYQSTKCITYRDYIEIHFKRTAVELMEIESVNPWKEALEVFFETSSPNDIFAKSTSLTQNDINWINTQLASLVKLDANGNEIPLFYGIVNEKEIRLIRDNV